MESIHQRLKRLRQQKGVTMQAVAQATKIPVSTYKEWENGRQIRGEPYPILANYFEVSLEELITGKKGASAAIFSRIDELGQELLELKKDLLRLL